MKVLHLNTFDYSGGAAQGMFILHKKLINLGIDSILLVQDKVLRDNTIIKIYDDNEVMIRNNLDTFPTRFYKSGLRIMSNALIDSPTLIDKIKDINPDIVHLHWICRALLSVEDIAKINKPIIWTLRDWWPMSGGCHHPLDCNNYQNECGNCHLIKSADEKDITYQNLLRKKIYIKQKNITIIGISQQMVNDAKKSSLFKDFDIRLIYNNVDDTIFHKISPQEAKNNLSIKSNKRIISIGSNNLEDPHKGLDYFIKALELISNEKFLILIFGQTNNEFLKKINYDFLYFGYVGKTTLRNIYCASELFVAPSLFEPFGKTIAEAMLCGTPAICFKDAGGPSEIISHKKDGYLANKYDIQDLAHGIKWILYNKKYKNLSENAIKKIVSNFSATKIAQEYIHLYKQKSLENLNKITNNEFCKGIECLSKVDNLNLLGNKLNELLSPNKSYVIYGYGYFGQYLQYILKKRKIIFIDKDYSKINNTNIFHPSNINNINYDKLIIAVLNKSQEIKDYLQEIKVQSSKIIDINDLITNELKII
ncbi:MAG: hypothetical protein C0626_12820 [Arcobacter sp.]|uniref:glycosyltransferase n=1 Tax=uncultured Arcobacter sp. TaxID=165434 RepID=UPI000CC11D9A|nr:glycosyltransferase [uncultured Arcobacter sp.]PLY08724.1 MAG: hypothetical protein C0626_12820 [Arcobacter sp.]